MQRTKIDWCDYTWNVVTGCTKVSQGCAHCFAEGIAHRFWGERKFTDVQCHNDRLDQPLHVKKPGRVFVNSMSDLFHPDVPDEFITEVFIRMYESKDLTFIILTKRPERMLSWIRSDIADGTDPNNPLDASQPLPNVWLGVSVEDQKTADERIPLLLQTPAAVRFVSVEPMLGAVDLTRYLAPSMQINADDKLAPETAKALIEMGKLAYRQYAEPSLDWVICGGESGPNARPMHPDWAWSLRDQCIAANTPLFFKQWGEWSAIREFPTFQKWVQKAQTWLSAGDICMDATGKVCRIGGDFETAQYPITIMRKVGKKNAGSLLDGKVWNQYPEAPHA